MVGNKNFKKIAILLKKENEIDSKLLSVIFAGLKRQSPNFSCLLGFQSSNWMFTPSKNSFLIILESFQFD